MAGGKRKAPHDAPRDDGGAPPVSAAALAPGLHFVATPIGTADDITLRALDTLRAADVIAAEDTRTARRLMEMHSIPVRGRPLVPYHDHNGPEMRPRLIAMLKDGARMAYVSDAGTPLVADPGYQLARAAIAADIPVTAAPGASSVLAALTVSGLPSDRFLFAGFPPPQAAARRTWIEGLVAAQATVIMFESPRRVHRLLGELCEVFGEEREAAFCRELTKRFEDVRRGSLGRLRDDLSGQPPKGECVLVVDRRPDIRPSEATLEDELRDAMKRESLKVAAAEVAQKFGMPRRDVYQTALRLKGESGSGERD
ncbi:16S rRNA (cytidine(1402)-2'-O)-methyltransferase [Roseibacterium sp. SDUM158017]|uniref:16S rRNA (cytidine(1402)-2'-O)-methyltransferase n=1 Tax=Roseicyclus salinarum TaxID=3036773 RepID=UPI002414DD25|nr:16S rRNA (cytidine(1402)-2'-O)-methyltransferase [Roseibacterium sp. SDUM158017]MDG4647221.1 16S rRNA (cytidine(1402)-2'-O)-methyltransferase [Roseibacterium sp. SDUM158017]